MISEYVKEQKRYTQAELAHIFHRSKGEAVPVIRRLKQFGVLKSVKASDAQKNRSDLLDGDVEIVDVEVDDRIYFYVFTFVGVIMVGDLVLKCYPKYIFSTEHPLDEMRQVMRVITKYNRYEEQIVNLFNGDAENRSFNILAVISFLLNDYYEYGLYSNSENVIEINGEGDILWGRTIDENFPIISNGRPYYMELLTRRTVNDEADYFHRLHQTVLTECSKKLKNAQLSELFEIEPLKLTENEISDFGDTEYILSRISGELSMQFNTRKQILLKTIYAFIAADRCVVEINDDVSLFGTNSFNLVWEKACAAVFNNMLQAELRNLPLPLPLNGSYKAQTKRKLIDIIEKPVWAVAHGSEDIYSHVASDTMIPDFVTISGNWFIIFDAKYYNLYMEKDALRGQPGIESITKQYLYQLAYKDFTQKHRLYKVKNCFLFPTEKDECIDKGYVELGMLHQLGLENIAVRLLPAHRVFESYLSEAMMNIEELHLDN